MKPSEIDQLVDNYRAELEAAARPDATLKARIVGFSQDPHGNLEEDIVNVEVAEYCFDLRLDAGTEIKVQMRDHPSEPHLIVRDLIIGCDTTNTPECGPGSIITFYGCSLEMDADTVQASSFHVFEAVVPSVGPRR